MMKEVTVGVEGVDDQTVVKANTWNYGHHPLRTTVEDGYLKLSWLPKTPAGSRREQEYVSYSEFFSRIITVNIAFAGVQAGGRSKMIDTEY